MTADIIYIYMSIYTCRYPELDIVFYVPCFTSVEDMLIANPLPYGPSICGIKQYFTNHYLTIPTINQSVNYHVDGAISTTANMTKDICFFLLCPFASY